MNAKIYCPYCRYQLITKFIDERERLFCPKCDIPIYENPIPAAAAVVLNNEGEILLVKRKVEPGKGAWCLPGGFVEMDENPEKCCLRELKEETNLEADIKKLVGVFLSENPVYKSVLVIGYSLDNVRGKIKAGDDSEEVMYFNTQNLPAIAFESHLSLIREVLEGQKIRPAKIQYLKRLTNLGAYVISSNNHCDLVKKSCQAGVRIVQYRDKVSSRKVRLDIAKKIREITCRYNTLFIVNDYIDIALISKADGVHLGQDDISISEARKITQDKLIFGISTHSVDQAMEAQKNGADYIAIGPVFATPTKKDYPPVGIEVVKKVLKMVSVPVVAIGGLNLNNIKELKRIGIRNVAMVREFQQNPEHIVKQVNEMLINDSPE